MPAWRAPLALTILLLVGACEDPRELQSRQAVKQLIKASPTQERAAREKLATFGSFALVDIEQELHGAKLATRIRLIAAIETIGSPEALPLLKFLERRDEDTLARDAAKQARIAIERPSPKSLKQKK